MDEPILLLEEFAESGGDEKSKAVTLRRNKHM